MVWDRRVLARVVRTRLTWILVLPVRVDPGRVVWGRAVPRVLRARVVWALMAQARVVRSPVTPSEVELAWVARARVAPARTAGAQLVPARTAWARVVSMPSSARVGSAPVWPARPVGARTAPVLVSLEAPVTQAREAELPPVRLALTRPVPARFTVCPVPDLPDPASARQPRSFPTSMPQPLPSAARTGPRGPAGDGPARRPLLRAGRARPARPVRPRWFRSRPARLRAPSTARRVRGPAAPVRARPTRPPEPARCRGAVARCGGTERAPAGPADGRADRAASGRPRSPAEPGAPQGADRAGGPTPVRWPRRRPSAPAAASTTWRRTCRRPGCCARPSARRSPAGGARSTCSPGG